MVNALQGLIDAMHASMLTQEKQLTLCISKLQFSTHCIPMAKMVGYRAKILNCLQLHPVISTLNDVYKEFLSKCVVQINRTFNQINKKMPQSRLIPVSFMIAQRILLKIA